MWRPAIARIARRLRARHLLVLDLLGIVVAAYAALALRYDRFIGFELAGLFLPILGLLLAVRTAVNVRFGLYSRGWRFASIPDVVRIVGAVVVGSTVSVALFYTLSAIAGPVVPAGFPRSFWPAEMLLSIAILGGGRFAIRAAYDWAPQSGAGLITAQRLTLLYGAGRTGVLMARSAERNPAAGVVPVGFLDDDPSLAGKIVAGLRVFGGRDQLARVADVTGARTLLITMPSAPGAAVRPVVDAALGLGLEVRTVPPLTDLLDGSVDAYRMRRVRVEDLLRRPIVTEHVAGVTEIVRGPGRDDHRRRRFDRLRARPPGLRPRPPPTHPRRPRREPALPAPARARGPRGPRQGPAASSRSSSPTSPIARPWTS